MAGATIREKEPFTALFFCRHGATDYPENRFYPSGSSPGQTSGSASDWPGSGGIESETNRPPVTNRLGASEDQPLVLPHGGPLQMNDPGLNEQGRHQAERLGKYLAELGHVDALYVSPTLRTRQTMQPIEQGRNLSVTVIPELGEREMGQWAGCSAEEIQQKDPEGWRRWKTDLLLFVPPGGESLQAFSRRVTQAVDSIVRKETGRTVVLVTHVGPIRVITAAALGIPLENCKRLVVAPGSVTRIHCTKSWPNLILFGHQP